MRPKTIAIVSSVMLGVVAAACAESAGATNAKTARTDGVAACANLLTVANEVAAQKPIAGRTIDQGLQSAINFADKAALLDSTHWKIFDWTLRQYVAELRHRSTPTQAQTQLLSNDCGPYARP